MQIDDNKTDPLNYKRIFDIIDARFTKKNILYEHLYKGSFDSVCSLGETVFFKTEKKNSLFLLMNVISSTIEGESSVFFVLECILIVFRLGAVKGKTLSALVSEKVLSARS